MYELANLFEDHPPTLQSKSHTFVPIRQEHEISTIIIIPSDTCCRFFCSSLFFDSPFGCFGLKTSDVSLRQHWLFVRDLPLPLSLLLCLELVVQNADWHDSNHWMAVCLNGGQATHCLSGVRLHNIWESHEKQMTWQFVWHNLSWWVQCKLLPSTVSWAAPSVLLEGVSCGFNPPSSTQILHDPQFPAFDWWREEMAKPAQAGIQDPSCHQISHERWVPFVPSGSYALLRYRSCMNAATVFSLRKDCSDNSHAATGVIKHSDYDNHHFHRSYCREEASHN